MIYVACPPRYVTGGIELLHQLTAELRQYTEAKILYIDRTPNMGDPQPREYDIYGNSYVINSRRDGITIVPEIWAHLNAEVIYWESVDNYFNYHSDYELRHIPETTIHLAQSKYAVQFLESNGFKNIIEVSDYLNDDFFISRPETTREPVVLYNPAKGLEFTEQLFSSGLLFIPVTGMKRAEVINLMHRSKVYIDFGNHPGKDRMPREAAICGCCVITGRNGSAMYDIPIPEEYKIERMHYNIPEIINRISDCIENYDIRRKDFDAYRDSIRAEKEQFKEGVKQLAHEIQHRYSGA